MVVEALNKGGCTLIKFGQWMSMRPDMFPQDLVTALASYQKKKKPRAILRWQWGMTCALR